MSGYILGIYFQFTYAYVHNTCVMHNKRLFRRDGWSLGNPLNSKNSQSQQEFPPG